LSDDEVVEMYDAEARQAANMEKLTRRIFVMTVVVTVATLVMVVIAVQG